MKPSVNLFRYLAALAPLTLGVVLSGCGGLLGSVNGEAPAPTRFTVTGTAAVESAVAGTATNQTLAPGSVVRVLRVTGSGPNDVTVVGTGVVGTNGTFSIPVEIPAFEADSAAGSLFQVEVVGTAGTSRVFVLAPFVPTTSTVTANPGVAATLAALNLQSSTVSGKVGAITQDQINTLVSQLVSGLSANASGLRLAISAGQGNRETALAQLAIQVTAVFNALVDSVEIVVNNQVEATSSKPGSITIDQGATGTLLGRARTASGTILLVGVDFNVLSGSTNVTVTQTGTNTASVRGVVVGGKTVVQAQIAVPGGTEAPQKTAELTLTVIPAHQQGHIQGGGSGG